MGVVTPVGSDINTFWENITKGVSGIVPITQFDAAAFDCRIAGEVQNFDPALYFKEKKEARRADRFVQLAMGAATHAMNDAGFPNGLSDRGINRQRRVLNVSQHQPFSPSFSIWA